MLLELEHVAIPEISQLFPFDEEEDQEDIFANDAQDNADVEGRFLLH